MGRVNHGMGVKTRTVPLCGTITGATTRTVVPSREPQPALWYHHGNYNPHCGTIMGATTRTVVPQ